MTTFVVVFVDIYVCVVLQTNLSHHRYTHTNF